MTAKVVIDIETVPDQKPDARQKFIDEVTAPGNYKKPESIQTWLDENAETVGDEQWRKTALDGTYGEIISIAWSVGGQGVSSLYRTLEQNEFDLLQAFYDDLYREIRDVQESVHTVEWIGHNIGFDLRFLWQRSIVNGVKPSVSIPYDAKPWSDLIFDTMNRWGGKNMISLDKLAKALGWEGEEDIKGADVWDAVLAGNYSEVEKHNKIDVEKTQYIYNKLTFNA